MKTFNTTAVCISSKHYMVDISERVAEIKKMVDAGKYFTINRARQYGKTTTLAAIKTHLLSEYTVVGLDFQQLSNGSFASEDAFVKAFSRMLVRKASVIDIPDDILEELKTYVSSKGEAFFLDELFATLSNWCNESDKPLVLVIDEVDSASNNQVFLDFLAQLRNGYISRDTDNAPAFQSVILAGVTDVRYLKSKIRDDSEHKVNSPWNIATDFDIDMSLSEDGIRGMLDEYEQDHQTGMDTAQIAKQIREYTNGYPYLVSRICQIIDERMVVSEATPDVAGSGTAFHSLSEAWTEFGVDEAVKKMLSESNNPLFESLTGKLINYPALKKKLRCVLMRGETVAWLPYDEEQQQLFMYGFIRNEHNTVAISNRIFEMLLYIQFIGENDQNVALKQSAVEAKSIFVEEDGYLDVPKIMKHFIREHNRIHGADSESFLEEEGRERFITYVSGIINGTGTYSIEEQTRDHRRTDLVIHYLGRRYIIELKIWRGDRYNEKGEQQILDYLDYFGLTTGYMLSFNFNQKKEPGVQRIEIAGKTLYEGIV